MIVMKFGGASVRDALAIKNVAQIIGAYRREAGEPILIIVSAMDKTTNHLEKLAKYAETGNHEMARTQFERIKAFHRNIIAELFEAKAAEIWKSCEDHFEHIGRILEGILLLGDFPRRTYDRIVSRGELLSSLILSAYLSAQKESHAWIDVRKVIRTDNNFKQANVIWSQTRSNIEQKVLPLLEKEQLAVTQGFIASTPEGQTTTLGREGSDYTAAIFANLLSAKKVVVWKDVPGILNADPRQNENAVRISQMPYERAVEMTFYGATVIHPKTIRPLYEKNIPLHVKYFKDRSAPGTLIAGIATDKPIRSETLKKRQLLIHLQAKSFSFMEEQLLNRIFAQAAQSKLQINLIQRSAVSLSLCVNQAENALTAFVNALTDEFRLTTKENLNLLTVIHFVEEDWKLAKSAIWVQQSGNQLHLLYPAE